MFAIGTEFTVAKKTDFNMAGEIRELLEADGSLTGKQVYAALKKKHPKAKINEASCGVAFSNQRKKLGLSRGATKTKVVRKPIRQSADVDIESLRAAKTFLAACGGDSNVAQAALRQLSSLQL